MRAHVSMNLLSELRNTFNKFNNTGTPLLDSIFHMTLKLHKNRIFCCENVKILPSFTQRYNERHYITLVVCKPLVVYRFYCMVLYHSQPRRHVISTFSQCWDSLHIASVYF